MPITNEVTNKPTKKEPLIKRQSSLNKQHPENDGIKRLEKLGGKKLTHKRESHNNLDEMRVSDALLAIEPPAKLPLGRNRDRNESLLIGEDDSDNHFSP